MPGLVARRWSLIGASSVGALSSLRARGCLFVSLVRTCILCCAARRHGPVPPVEQAVRHEAARLGSASR